MTDGIVVLGGTFNPVHFGHLIVVREVAEHFGARRVLLMPAATPPHKNGTLAAGEHRLAMLRLAVADDPLFEVSTVELDRAGVSYTLDTLVQLRRAYGQEVELLWVVGMDMLMDLPNWHRAEEVVTLARIVTAARPPMPEDMQSVVEPLRESFGADRAAQIVRDILPTSLIDISSTQIRRRVADGRPVSYLTAASVVRYIGRHGLYAALNEFQENALGN